MLRKLKLSLLLPLAAAIVLALVALSPIRRIRLGLLPSSRIGHLVGMAEAYLSKVDAGLVSRRSNCVDVFFFEEFVCNREVAEQWRRMMHMFPLQSIAYVVYRLLSMSSHLSRRHVIPEEDMNLWGLENERAIRKYRGHIAISSDMAREGDKLVSEFARGKPLVCIHARDSSYLRHTQPNFDFSYHDFRDWRVADLALAVEELTSRGFCVVRMGAVVGDALPFAGSDVFDYARSGVRSDRMDLYLASRCAFWIGDSSGLMTLPFGFRRPMAILNHVNPLFPAELMITMYENSLWTFKRYWSEAEDRLLTFREIRDSGVGNLFRAEDFKAAGIRLIDNSPQENVDAALEMVERVNGTWAATTDDEKLQSRFWALCGEDAQARAQAANSRIGARFLSAYPELLS